MFTVAGTILAILVLIASRPDTSTPPVASAGRSADATSPSASLAPPPTIRATPPSALAAMLAALVVTPEHREGYDRELFPHWTDDDGDGCNTRYEVLLAEAVAPPSIAGSCDLTGGTWLSPYDGQMIDGAAGVQIDHVVALAEAWYSGADTWTTERRERFANDLDTPLALVTVSPETNEAKGADDPAEWVPPRASAVCPYVEAWIAVKYRWRLAIDAAEHEALERLVARCPRSPLPLASVVP